MRSLCTLLILLALTITPTGAIASAASEPGGFSTASDPHVRPLTDRLVGALLEGLRRSPTLRSIVQQLDASDVIVYLRVQHTLPSRFAGSLVWLGTTAQVRYLSVSLNPELPNYALIATIGHELQHALEVAQARSVVDSGTLSALYRQIGINHRPWSEEWETEMAQKVGQRVRQEMASARVARVAESIQPANPADWFVLYRREQDAWKHK